MKTQYSPRINRTLNSSEVSRILRQYAGIFPQNIKEFGERFIKRNRKFKNYSK